MFIFVFYCTHVRMSYVLNSYLLTYLKKFAHFVCFLAVSLLVHANTQQRYTFRPPFVTLASSLPSFKRQLKTFLFQNSFP